jgi:hypothetical protein
VSPWLIVPVTVPALARVAGWLADAASRQVPLAVVAAATVALSAGGVVWVRLRPRRRAVRRASAS